MKIYVTLFSALFTWVAASAQLKTSQVCPEIKVDILEGRINGTLLPNSTNGQIKVKLPCFTSTEEDGTTAKCGAGVFYKDKDLYFYTTRDYVEIGPDFKGALSIPLLGAPRQGLFKWLGSPQIKDINWDAFQTQYGVLILYYNKAAKVNKIQFSSQKASSIELCE
jgi:hypothetical protein